MISEEDAANFYKESNFKTAGPVKSWQLVLDKAIFLLNNFEDENRVDTSVRVQNMIVLMQQSLNVREKTARDLHKALAYIWDALQSRSAEDMKRASVILSELRQTLGQI